MRSVALRTGTAGVVLLASAAAACGSDWPQWRGPDRSNVSAETGLLKQWPPGGPPLAWKAEGLGDGVVPVAVAGERPVWRRPDPPPYLWQRGRPDDWVRFATDPEATSTVIRRTVSHPAYPAQVRQALDHYRRLAAAA
jgi:hypothetical protein